VVRRVWLSMLAATGLAAASAPPSAAVSEARVSSVERVTPRPDVLIGAFGGGYVGTAGEVTYPIRVVRLGELDLRSGRLVLADPLYTPFDLQPLDLPLAPGRYTVDLAVADTGSSGRRIALARLVLSDAPIVRWSLAHEVGADPTTLSGDQILGYPVDSGTGGFLDQAAFEAQARADGDDADASGWATRTDRWVAAGEANAQALGIPYGLAIIEQTDAGGLAIFSTGWGDGYYASWVGFDARDRPVVIVTDFAVIEAVDIPLAD